MNWSFRSKTQWQMFLLVSGRHGVGAQSGVSKALHQAPVVQTLDSAIRRINNYPADKYYGN